MLYQVVKHLRASGEVFKEALLTVLDRKLSQPMLRLRGNCSSRTPPVSQDPDRACQGDHLSVCGASKTPQCGNGWLPPGGGTPRPTPLHLSDAGAILVARYGSGTSATASRNVAVAANSKQLLRLRLCSL